MNCKTKKGLMVCTILLAVISTAFTSIAAAVTIVPVQTFGTTYGELSARWWQWLFSIPAAINPNLDSTGANCDQGQFDDVWFLAGAFGGIVERSCTIPAGKPIFFPVVTSAVVKPQGNETLLDLRQQAAGFVDAVEELSVSIDDEEVTDLTGFRVRSPAFTVIAPPKGLISQGISELMVSDGFWLLLSPLEPGEHEIHFHAEKPNVPPQADFVLDITYHLTVE